jgi:hypothetical protein
MSSFDETSNPCVDLFELPQGFVPGERDVVIGKGKKFYFHSGNQWLRTLVASMLSEYTKAQTKGDKSNIISDVVEYVRNHGRFVKRDLKTGMWAYAEPLLCREKCSQTFRDNLAQTYRSSNVAKRNKRRQEQQDKKLGTCTDIPEAKRMKPSIDGPALNARIPSNLFDLDMELWSPKTQARSMSLDVSSASMTGATDINHLTLSIQPRSGNAGSATANDGNASSNNLAIWLSTLAQGLSCNSFMDQTTTDPFEPTPLPPVMPPLTGGATSALENAILQQQANNCNSFQQQQKRHSLAPLFADDWFNFSAPAADGSYHNMAAAFAA